MTMAGEALIPMAFYAPLKSPDHDTPSGDRRVARLLLSALQDAGFAPQIASRLRMLDKTGDAAHQKALAEAAHTEAAALIDLWRDAPAATRPRLWLTYHCYYKAPDIIGPLVARALAIPYVVAEGSRAAKRAKGPWAAGHAAAEAALDAADLLFVTTDHDRPALAAAKPPHQKLADLPPFMDMAGWPVPPARQINTHVRLLSVAMMREGAKLDSYRQLTEALALLPTDNWMLTIVGDGPARASVEAAFAPHGQRIHYRGLVEDQSELAAVYASADIFVWPAVDEAYGMALLEAQAMGLPVVAGRHGGVSSVVQNGVGGLLTAPDDTAAFAEALAGLVSNPEARIQMGNTGQAVVRNDRTLASAAAILRREIGYLLESHSP